MTLSIAISMVVVLFIAVVGWLLLLFVGAPPDNPPTSIISTEIKEGTCNKGGVNQRPIAPPPIVSVGEGGHRPLVYTREEINEALDKALEA